MALRDQPYLPLYVNQFLTDEKLNECSASTVGVYIKIMCLMHKPKHYGKVLLKQKDKQIDEQNIKQAPDQKTKHLLLFCYKFARLLPFNFATIYEALTELLEEEVLQLDGDYLLQKRMVHDNQVSISRSKSGKIGGKSTQAKVKGFASNFAQAKTQANTVYVNTNNNTVLINTPKEVKNFYEKSNEEILGLFKNLEESDIENWRKFVSLCANDDDKFYTQVFTAKFVFPVDFKKLVAKGFTEPLWHPVLKKLCSVGLEPKHELWHRIPDAIGWLKKDVNQHNPEADNLSEEARRLLYQET